MTHSGSEASALEPCPVPGANTKGTDTGEGMNVTGGKTHTGQDLALPYAGQVGVVDAYLTKLPDVKYVVEPEYVERMIVQLQADGRITFQGGSRDMARFIEECKAAGLVLDIERISPCG